MKNIKYLYLIVILFLSINSRASHYSGYDISLTHLTGDNYKFKLTIFKDSNPSTAAMPTSMDFKTYVNGTNVNANLNFTAPRVSMSLANFNPEDCLPNGSNLNLQVGIFEYTLTSTQALGLNNNAGYYFTAESCCRQDGASNVINSSGSGINFTMDFPRLSSGSATRFNSSPSFTKYPSKNYCIGKPYSLNWNCTDTDGDSLSYSLITPSDGSSITKPFGSITFAPGYNINYNIIDGVPDLTINPETGVVNFIATKLGIYIVGFKCDEWRKINGVAVKIGSIIREFQLEIVLCTEVAPVTTIDSTQTKYVVDTIDINNEYTLTFTSRDTPTDSLFMYILPNLNINENILNPNLYLAKWGEVGNLQVGSAAENLVIHGSGIVQGQFKFKALCRMARNTPYTFKVVVRDQTCPSPFYDTTYVSLYVTKKPNSIPFFVSPDTIKSNLVKYYYINEGEKFSLDGDSIIKTYDKDSLNTVTISVKGDLTNGSVNSNYNFISKNDTVHSTASFVWQTTCKDGRDTPYKFKFFAVDDDCLKRDSASFEINIFVKNQTEAYPIIGDSTIIDTSLVYNYYTSSISNANYYWYGNNSNIISGQGSNSVQVKWNSTSAGKLNCVFSNSNTTCTDTSSIEINKATGISNIKNETISIYPNPTTNTITISGLSANETSRIVLLDVQGKIVLSKEISEEGTIDLSHLSNGVYILKAGNTARRLIKM